jgi:hypothetical protein
MQGSPHEVAVETPRRGRRGLGERRPGNRKDDIPVARIGSLRTLWWLWPIAVSAFLPGPAFASELDLSDLPALHAGKVEFQRDIRPLLENACFRCHGPERPKSGFRLDNRASALAGGDLGPAIFPGNSTDSPLIHYVARLVRDMEMPPTGKGEPLKPFEIALLRAWIDQGVDYGGADQPERARLAFDLTTGAGHVAVSGDRAKFREQSWMNDGWSGGVTEFRASGPLDEHTTFTLDGRVLFEQDDARLWFEVRRQDWGGLAGGVETRRRWYDDSGGFHPSFTPPQFSSGEDLALDFGRAWFDLYLDRAGWPEARLGYELQFRDGTESSTRWGTVTPPTRNLYPSFREVDEHTHILKFDVAKDFAGWRIADSLRVEWHDQDNRRVMVTAFNTAKPGPEKFTEVRERYTHTQGANSLTVEKSVREWLGVHAGYLYSWLDGAATFDQASFLTDNAALPPAAGFTAFGVFADRFYTANRILLDRHAHVGSLGARLGPWEELVFHGGVQGDWSRQTGFADVAQRIGSPTATVFPVLSWSELDRQLLEERAGVRFTGLPYSTLYAEARWQQEEVNQYEDQTVFGFPSLDRGTAAEATHEQYRFGSSTSPWQRVLLAAHYQQAKRVTDYAATPDDTSAGPQGFGYPNFITGRRIDSDTVEGSLTTRLTPRLKSRFKYQFTQADYETRHQALFNGTPGGTLTAGEQDAHVFTAGFNWQPWGRLGFDLAGTFADTELTTFVNNNPGIVPYAGEVWSVNASVNWSVDERTSINVLYVWSLADYRQENFAAGLPLGIEYRWHQLRTTVTRQLNEQLAVNLLYFFQSYDEPSAGGFNDYAAHGVFAGLTWSWRE